MQTINQPIRATSEIELASDGRELSLSIADAAFQATGDLVELVLERDGVEQLATQLRGPAYSAFDPIGRSLALNVNDWQLYEISGYWGVFLTIADADGDEATARLTYAEAKHLADTLTSAAN